MINFQDILLQKGLRCGPLWSDEGVYRIAKELQLLNPVKFSNIFLGLGGFRMEKMIITCCGKYLAESGIESALVENEIFRPNVAKSVMEGGHYIRGKRFMSMIAEAMECLQISAFLDTTETSRYETLFKSIHGIQFLFEEPVKNKDRIVQMLETLDRASCTFFEDFDTFVQQGCAKSKSFFYWNQFISDIAPILRDLTRSYRESDWSLHLSAVFRAMKLCFAFDRMNYRRWLPLYYEDCLSLPTKFPEIHECFMSGGFTVRHTTKAGSCHGPSTRESL